MHMYVYMYVCMYVCLYDSVHACVLKLQAEDYTMQCNLVRNLGRESNTAKTRAAAAAAVPPESRLEI